MEYRIGIDMGGTGIKAGVVNERYEIVYHHTMPTDAERPFEAVVADMALAAKIAAERSGLSMNDISAVGVGCPGFIDPVSGNLVSSPNTGWENVPLITELNKHISAQIRINNDANCAMWGEALAGAAKGRKNVIMVTLGTGVGGGFIIDGRLFTGGDGMGAEIGHIPFVFGGQRCNCGKYGCYEAYASVTALIRQTREMLDNSDAASVLRGGDITGKTVFDAAKAGDPLALEVVERYTDYVAGGIAGLVILFRPEIIIIGGGLSGAGRFLNERIERKLPNYGYAIDAIGCGPVVTATLGNDAGIIGAAYLAE